MNSIGCYWYKNKNRDLKAEQEVANGSAAEMEPLDEAPSTSTITI